MRKSSYFHYNFVFSPCVCQYKKREKKMNQQISDAKITRLISEHYFNDYLNAIESDVIIVGAGPSGLVAGYKLAEAGKKVVVMEKRMTPGGGVWGGGKGFNKVILEPYCKEILKEIDLSYKEEDDYLVVSSVALAAALIKKAVESGVTLLNLHAVEDVYFDSDRRMAGVVANDGAYKITQLHVDPLTFESKLVIDSTGHEGVVLNCLVKRNIISIKGEDIMNAQMGEEAVIAGTGEVYPGLIICGMSVSQFNGTPRMGPIFGGMLISGSKAAELAISKLN